MGGECGWLGRGEGVEGVDYYEVSWSIVLGLVLVGKSFRGFEWGFLVFLEATDFGSALVWCGSPLRVARFEGFDPRLG